MSESPDNQRGPALLDYPNLQVLGLGPPWTEDNTGNAPTPTPQAQSGGTSLDEMNKAELLDYARELGVSPANNDMTKDELRAAVDEKLAEGG